MDRIHEWLNPTPDDERRAVKRRLQAQADQLRMLRIDAGLPVERRHYSAPSHPGRRGSDA